MSSGDRHEAALRAALAERDRIWEEQYGPAVGEPPRTTSTVVARIVEAALTAADAHDGAVLCSDGSRVHDFKGQRHCPGCGWGGIFADKADQ